MNVFNSFHPHFHKYHCELEGCYYKKSYLRVIFVDTLHVNYSEGYLSIPLALKYYYSKKQIN